MTVVRFGVTPKMKPVSPRRATVVAALDIGTSKIVCLIARLAPQAPQETLRRRSHGVRVLGFAHTAASGMKGGSVVDLVAAEEMIRNAIDIAEKAAELQLESVVVSLSGGRLGSERFIADIALAGGAVGDGDIARVLAAASRHSVRDGRAVLHSLPIAYQLDAAVGIREPRGMLGQRFGVDMHMVTADVATVRNLMLTVERSHLDVEAVVASPYAAGLAVLADDEADLGAAVIDLGAGTTTLAVFSGGRFVHADGFALGALHVTMDLARGLNTRIADAERIKAI
jgi:cell division protein FtsA